MLEVTDIIWLVAIAAAAVVKIGFFKSVMQQTRVAGFIGTTQDPTVGYWLSLMMVLPLLGVWTRVEFRLMPEAAIPLSLPISCAMIAVGIGYVLTRKHQHEKESSNGPTANAVAKEYLKPTTGRVNTFTIVAAVAVGLILAIQAFAGPLTIGIGQSLLAAAIVVLWITSPPSPKRSEFRKDNHAFEIRVKRFFILLLAAAQGFCMFWIGPRAMDQTLAIAGSIIAIEMVMLLAIVSRLSSSSAVASTGLRLGTLAVLLGIGSLSMGRFGQAWLAYRGGDYGQQLLKIQGGIVRGFEEVIFESALLIVAATLASLSIARETWTSKLLGFVCILAGATFIAWRLSALS